MFAVEGGRFEVVRSARRPAPTTRHRVGGRERAPPSRSSTTTDWTQPRWTTASSIVDFSSIALPRRSVPSAVSTTFASASTSRAATAGAARPEKIGTTTAPTSVQA